MLHLEVLDQTDGMARTNEPVSQFDVFDGRPAIGFIKSPHFLENLPADGPAV